jgi:4-diphosphocytidyl-2-C-methyl-D-erythritol kinase
LLAPAKLNLYLHVVGRRADGYHLIDSLVAFADIGDSIAVSQADRLSLAARGAFAGDLGGDPRQNLIWRAAESLAKQLGRAPGAAIDLEKNLPVASGIGGGSSDAATALLALCELWGVRLAPEKLMDLAAELGADVPVCLTHRASWMGGIGERVEPAPALPPAAVVLVNPRQPLATRQVFAAIKPPYGQPARFSAAPRSVPELANLLAERRNDLTATAQAQMPVIGDMLKRLSECDGVLLARMSGSGATCFGLCENEFAAQATADRLRRSNPDWWVASGRLI